MNINLESNTNIPIYTKIQPRLGRVVSPLVFVSTENKKLHRNIKENSFKDLVEVRCKHPQMV